MPTKKKPEYICGAKLRALAAKIKKEQEESGGYSPMPVQIPVVKDTRRIRRLPRPIPKEGE
jgi:hypothetical protein